MRSRKKKITSVISIWLMTTVFAACVLSLIFTYILLYNRTKKDAIKLVVENARDVKDDVYAKTQVALLENEVQRLKKTVDQNHYQNDHDGATDYFEKKAKERNNDLEFTIVKDDGVITSSSVRSVCGDNILKKDSQKYWQTADLLKMYLTAKKQNPDYMKSNDLFLRGEVSPQLCLDGQRKLHYLGISLDDWPGILVVGFSNNIFKQCCAEQAVFITENRHVGHNGYVMIVDCDNTITGDLHKQHVTENFPHPGLISDTKKKDDQRKDRFLWNPVLLRDRTHKRKRFLCRERLSGSRSA